jgi:Flp pilus assembly protein TadG
MVERFTRDIRGGVAVIMGLAAVAIVAAMGVALDYSRAIDLKSRLQAAADFAVLAGLNPQNTAPDLEAEARKMFLSSLSADDAKLIQNVDAKLEQDSSGRRRLSISYSSLMANTLMSVAGIDTTPVAGKASARIGGTSRPVRVHFLLDVSGSMGLAASISDRAKLKLATQNIANPDYRNCEFACHTEDHLNIARSNDVVLRYDVARQGIEYFVNRAVDESGSPANFDFGLTVFSTTITPLASPTSNVASFVNAMEQFELGDDQGTKDSNTVFADSLVSAANTYDGIRDPSRTELVILITDGLQSKNFGKKEDTFPLDPALCDGLKSNGRQLGVIYTQYIPIPDSGAYQDFVAPIKDQIDGAVKACASEGLFASGASPEEIRKAFETLFIKAKLAGRLYLDS